MDGQFKVFHTIQYKRFLEKRYSMYGQLEGLTRKELGRWGEEKARLHLENLGYRVLETNYRCKKGEIDLIVQKGNEIIAVEVKTRRTKCFGEPREAVNYKKKCHIKESIMYYVMVHNLQNYMIRFDVIEVYLERSLWQLCHIKYSF